MSEIRPRSNTLLRASFYNQTVFEESPCHPNPMVQTNANFTGIAVAVAVYAFFGTAVFPQWRNLERLDHAGIQIHGRIVAWEPANHQSVRYTYSVGSKAYSGAESVGGEKLGTLKIGDEIPVIYLPDRPAVSIPWNPSERYWQWTILLFGLLPCVSVFFWFRISRHG